MFSVWLASPSFAAEIPLQVFAAHLDFAEVRLSPTGEYVAAVVRDDERSSLVVLRTATREITTRLQLQIYNHVDDIWWASPRRLVASTTVQADGWSQPRRAGYLIAVDADGKNPQYLSGWRENERDYIYGWMIDPIADDDRQVLVKVEPHRKSKSDFEIVESAHKLDVETGAHVRVATAPLKGIAHFSADRSGRVLYVKVFEPLDKSRLFWRENEQSAWRELPIPDNLKVSVEQIDPDGSVIFTETTTREPFKTCVVRHEVGTLHGGKVLGCTQKPGTLLYSLDHREPIAVRVTEEDRPRIVYLASDHPDRLLLQTLERDLAKDSVLYLDYTRDGSKTLIKLMSDRDPGTYYLLDRAQNQARHLFSSRDKIDPEAMSPRRLIKLPASNASDEAFLTLPINGGSKPPLVVILRGFYGLTARWTWSADAQALASRGYAVLNINSYDSQTRRVEAPQPSLPDPAIAMADALATNLKWLRTQKLIDADRVCIYGDSYGAYVALTIAVRHPDLFRCVATEAGIVDIDTWLKDSGFSETAYGREEIALYMTGVGRSMSSPLERIDQLKAPLLLIHGEKDLTVPYSQAKLLMKALDQHQLPYEKYVEGSEAHGFYKQAHRIKRYERLLAFFDRYIGGTTTAD